jgi:hypothetical protein
MGAAMAAGTNGAVADRGKAFSSSEHTQILVVDPTQQQAERGRTAWADTGTPADAAAGQWPLNYGHASAVGQAAKRCSASCC